MAISPLNNISQCPPPPLRVDISKVTAFTGPKRVYYLSADEDWWDYLPWGVDGLTLQPIAWKVPDSDPMAGHAGMAGMAGMSHMLGTFPF